MSPRLPKVLMTSVVRSTQKGESHGGVYIVDLATGRGEQVLDWNSANICWEGRGGDRGLRGIAFHGDDIYIAASDELFVLDRGFKVKRSFPNRYLRECHEIFLADGRIYLTSTQYDSILEFDIGRQRYTRGHVVEWVGRIVKGPDGQPLKAKALAYRLFDPESSVGPIFADTTHLNSVWVEGRTMYLCGVDIERVLMIDGPVMKPYGVVPFWTHNARPFRGGLLYNSTEKDTVCWTDLAGNVIRQWPVVRQPDDKLVHGDIPKDYARASFARGLCTTEDLVIVGSSPSTVTAYRLDSEEIAASVNLTMDVRNCVHGLALWPW